MIELKGASLSVREQCELFNVNRSSFYYKEIPSQDDSEIMNLIHEIWLKETELGYRPITRILQNKGFKINRKRVLRLMRAMNLQAIYCKPNLSEPNLAHAIHPYLLKGLSIERPNQVWCTDITYIKMPRGFIYLIAIIDVHSRYIVDWSLSTSLDTSFCLDMLNSAFEKGVPGIINTDQGSQFTCSAWVNAVQEKGCLVSMDGKGRWADNIPIERFWRTLKYANIFLYSYETIEEARNGIGKYIKYYNEERPHQSLKYDTPGEVYRGDKVAAPYVLGQYKKKRKSKKFDSILGGLIAAPLAPC